MSKQPIKFLLMLAMQLPLKQFSIFSLQSLQQLYQVEWCTVIDIWILQSSWKFGWLSNCFVMFSRIGHIQPSTFLSKDKRYLSENKWLTLKCRTFFVLLQGEICCFGLWLAWNCSFYLRHVAMWFNINEVIIADTDQNLMIHLR